MSQTMTGLAQQYPHPWVAPMSLINVAYWTEILGGIRGAGVGVREFVLAVSEEQLRARIDADQVESRARRWRHDHVSQALTTFASLTDTIFIDASPASEQVDQTWQNKNRIFPVQGPDVTILAVRRRMVGRT